MKRSLQFVFTFVLTAIVAVAIITACGSNGTTMTGGGGTTAKPAFVFNSLPIGFQSNHGNVTARASLNSPFVVEAQGTTPGGGNFAGFCGSLDVVGGRAASVIYGIGRWTDANCADHSTPDTDVGVVIPVAGQIGNLTVDAVGTGTAADSGQMEVKIIHADGTQTITTITCSLGVSNNAKVHCGDNTNRPAVVVGDQVSARIFQNPGDSYRAVRVNIAYATPAF